MLLAAQLLPHSASLVKALAKPPVHMVHVLQNARLRYNVNLDASYNIINSRLITCTTAVCHITNIIRAYLICSDY